MKGENPQRPVVLHLKLTSFRDRGKLSNFATVGYTNKPLCKLLIYMSIYMYIIIFTLKCAYVMKITYF